MSCLNWQVEVYLTRDNGAAVPTTYWALWTVGEDQTAWYNLPCAQIRKISRHKWELSFPEYHHLETRYFKTLKAAKAMGIVIVQLEK
jgi:hypothetical protein